MKFTTDSQPQRRVVVTGLGVVSPLGLSLSETWDNLLKGQSGISPIECFDPKDHGVRFAGEIKNFDPEKFIPKKELKRMARFIQLSLASTEAALNESGLDLEKLAPTDYGVIIGVGMGGLDTIETSQDVYRERGPSRVSPFFIPSSISNLAPGQIAIKYNAQGPNFTTTSACTSGAHAIGEAAKVIQTGICKVMITGGSESAITPLSIAGFTNMKALSTRNDAPQSASRPFDVDRDGFVMAEASGTLILEDYEHAHKRGATIYGELVGYGVSCDAYHMTNPAPEGRGAALSMAMALKQSGLSADQVGYVNAHGTSTPAGDGLESLAVESVFKDHAKNQKLWVSSTKSMTGHALGAAGAIEAAFSLMSMKTGMCPPTMNLDQPSEECRLNYLPHVAQEKSIDAVLSNSFGFGGTNASLLFKKI